MNTLADTIVRPGYTSLRYAEMLLKDVTPEMFARRPRLDGGNLAAINHPAFCMGHLALYPAKVLGMCGLDPSHAAAPENWAALFEAGNECQDDPQGTSIRGWMRSRSGSSLRTVMRSKPSRRYRTRRCYARTPRKAA
jgi:hypothetical protein